MKALLQDPTKTEPGRASASRFSVFEGTASPEGSVTGNIGDYYIRRGGSVGGVLYVKESGHQTNTGWIAHGRGWRAEQIFISTLNQTDFTVTDFTISANDRISVYWNGMDLYEGASYDYTINVGANKIIFNKGVNANALIKIRQW